MSRLCVRGGRGVGLLTLPPTGILRRNWQEHGELYLREPTLWLSEQWPVRTSNELIELRPHQIEILQLFFTRDLTSGRLPWETYIWSEPKKSGKTEIGAGVGLWFAVTEPGIPEVYSLANDFDQARSRAFRAMWQVCDSKVKAHNPLLAAETELYKGGPPRIELADGSFIAAIPVDYAGEAGANQALTLWDELWGYMSEKARRLWDEFTPVPTRRWSGRLITTYAGFYGESELLWELYESTVLNGKRIHSELPIWEDKSGTTVAYWHEGPGRMPWHTEKYLAGQRATLRPATFSRLHLNQWTKPEGAFITDEQWDRLPTGPKYPAGDIPVYVGVDAAHKRDMTAATAVGWHRDGHPILLRATALYTRQAAHPAINKGVCIRCFNPEESECILLPDDVVERFLGDLRLDWPNIRVVRYDPNHFESAGLRLARRGYPMEEYAQTPVHLTAVAQALYDAVTLGGLLLAGSYPIVREHVLNCKVIDTGTSIRLIRTAESRKIDAAVALGQALSVAEVEGPKDVDAGPGIYFISPPMARAREAYEE